MYTHKLRLSGPPSPTPRKRARLSVVTQQDASSPNGDNDEWEYDNVEPIMPTSLSEQLTLIDQLLESSSKRRGETRYMVSIEWILKWKWNCQYITEHQEQDTPFSPGAVDNSSLVGENDQLLPNLIEGYNFISVPRNVWLCLKKWYGLSGTEIQSNVVNEDIVDFYPLAVNVLLACKTCPFAYYNNMKQDLNISRDTSVQDTKVLLLEAAGHNLDTEPDLQFFDSNSIASELYNYPALCTLIIHHTDTINTDDDGLTIGELCASGGTLVMNLPPPSPPCIFGSGFKKDYNTLFPYVITNEDQIDDSIQDDISTTCDSAFSLKHGLCGLINLGNTCFMNSALQCLSNTPQLCQWFLNGKYKHDLNRTNPLGMKGEIAESFGRLINDIWIGNNTSVDPQHFKETICRFNTSFTGNQQHDSQELLAFLLDGLHEDTNRILKKPYREMSGFEDMNDEQISQTSWDYHKARNDSIIVDLFHGQLKSRLVCNACQKVSVTFDPFMYLSLPLPILNELKIGVILTRYDPSKNLESMVITLDKNATVEHFKVAIAEQAKVGTPSKLLVLEIYDKVIYKVFSDYEPIASIQSEDSIHVYELPGPVPSTTPTPKLEPQNQPDVQPTLGSNYHYTSNRNDENFDGEKWIVFPVYCSTPSKFGSTFKNEQFGGPTLLAIQAKDATCPDNIYRLIIKNLERYTATKLFDEAQQPTQGSNTKYLPPAFTSSHTLEQQDHSGSIPPASTDTDSCHTRLDPSEHLFTMKIFTSQQNVNELVDIVPANVRNWQSAELEDLGYQNVKKSKEEHHGSATHGTIKDDKNIYMTNHLDSSNLSHALLPQAAATRPHTLIRQGEGILLVWKRNVAQGIFGVGKKPPAKFNQDIRMCGVNGDRWMHSDTVTDPALNIDPSEMTLAHCLDEFTKKEQLSNEDLWYCPQCKNHQSVTKKFDLWQLPEIMVIHLKRFGQTTALHDKIDAFIDFPTDALDMTDRVLGLQDADSLAPENRLIYDLYAVDNHEGSLGSGHYTTFAENWYNGKWYFFDDTRTSDLEKGNIVTSAAYLLFYKRRRSAPQNVSNAALGV